MERYAHLTLARASNAKNRDASLLALQDDPAHDGSVMIIDQIDDWNWVGSSNF
jgi:hypothetical protein